MHTCTPLTTSAPAQRGRAPIIPLDCLDALNARVNIAKPTDVVLGMFLESALTCIAGTEGHGVAEARRRQVLGNQKIVGFFKYPTKDLLKLVQLTLIANGHTQSIEGELERFGRAAVRVFLDSPVGKTMLMLGSIDVQRLLGAAPAAYKAVSSYGEQRYTRTGERSGVMTFRGDLLGPGWQLGILKQGLEQVCKVTPRIDVKVLSLFNSDFDLTIRW